MSQEPLDLNTMLLMLRLPIYPVNLGQGLSVNLQQVKSYQLAELEAKDAETTEPRPCIFFSETDFIELTDEQATVFKQEWNTYNKIVKLQTAAFRQIVLEPLGQLN